MKKKIKIRKAEARELALSITMELSESGISMNMVGKDELIAEAESIYQWLTQDLKDDGN